MKKNTQKLLAIVIILALITIIFLVIFFQGNKEKIEGISAKSLNLNLNDLPAGYKEFANDSSHKGLPMLNEPRESYRVIFFLGNTSNMSRTVDSFIVIFNTTNESIDFYNFSTIFFKGSAVEESKNRLGDESYGIEMKDNENNTIGYVHCFRISNIFAAVSYIYDDYSYAFDLSKIVEQRIYNSME
jgi:hypothetical protein